MKNNKRDNGYYWVLINGSWEIAHYENNLWETVVDDYFIQESDFEDIDENQITRKSI